MMNPSEHNPQAIHTMTTIEADKIARDVAEEAAKTAYDAVFHRTFENVYVEIMSGENEPSPWGDVPTAKTGNGRHTDQKTIC